MITDVQPRKVNRAGFLESERIKTFDLPQDGRLLSTTKSIESAMKSDRIADVRSACAEFLAIASEFYEVPACGVRVLAARPLRVREQWTTELFGDYSPETMLIRVWMRTAVRKEVTSFGTFVSTLCHEFCHHLDFQKFGFLDSKLVHCSAPSISLQRCTGQYHRFIHFSCASSPHGNGGKGSPCPTVGDIRIRIP